MRGLVVVPALLALVIGCGRSSLGGLDPRRDGGAADALADTSLADTSPPDAPPDAPPPDAPPDSLPPPPPPPPPCEEESDVDGDGFVAVRCGGRDCDDADPTIHPDRRERCANGRDDNCNDLADCDDFACSGQDVCTTDCPLRDLGSQTGRPATRGSTTAAPDLLTGTCVPNDGPEMSYRWTAPSRGVWVFDTNGSEYDTVLFVLRDCNGLELACDDDGGTDLQSRVQLRLQAGQQVVIVVAGYASSRGNFTLNITPSVPDEVCDDGLDNDGDGLVDCADPDCSGDPACAPACPEHLLGSRVGRAVATGSTLGGEDRDRGSCAPSDAAEASLAWRAPRAARYTFDTFGSSYDTLLYLRAFCGGPELACNNDAGSAQSRAQLDLTAGQSVVVFVDGFETSVGDYVLNITASEAGHCADVIDNDADGRIDCRDPNCRLAPQCCSASPEVCDNGVDDDCDGIIDCVDEDCRFDPVC